MLHYWRKYMSSQMIIRIEPGLKEKVNRVAKAEGKTTSEVVRGLIEEYVRDRDIGAYIDNLWGRIGKMLKPFGCLVLHFHSLRLPL